MAERIAVVTGASSGFGRLTVEALLHSGWDVVATMRNVAGANAAPAAALRALGARVVELDVTSDASVDAAAATILATGTPDLVVNNAGAAYFGVVEAFTPAQAERQFALNVFGPLRVNRAFLPAMRERGSGLIVYVTSIVGRFTFPLGGIYTASKYALEALAETAAYELAPFGVDVAIVQPGAYPTEIGAKSPSADDTARQAAYGAAAERFGAAMSGFMTIAQERDPRDVANAIVRLAELPQGERPLRTVVPEGDTIDDVNAASETLQRGVLQALNLADLLPKVLVR
jgi:NAD(P)-dependent dehydrogenase (short-subunit alcohol dehydrogenase family)